jgi:hypothetical protein
MLVDFLLNLKAAIRSSAERTGASLAGLAVLGFKRLLAAGALEVFVVFAVVVVLVLLGVLMVYVFPCL